MPTLRISDASTAATAADVLVVGVSQNSGRLAVVGHGLADSVLAGIAEDLKAVGCDGAAGGAWRIPNRFGLAAVSVLGVSTPPAATAGDLRIAGATAGQACAGVPAICSALPASELEDVQSLAEGLLLGCLPTVTYKSDPGKSTRRVIVLTDAGRATRTSARREAEVAARATSLVRDLVNEPPGHLPPAVLAERAAAAVSGLPVTVDVWDKRRLTREHMGGILAVGQGSANAPRLVHLNYAPNNPARSLALVGKGITFDSGGLSLKPAAAMMNMKSDMGGAAAVLAATAAIAELQLPIRVDAYLACAENMPSGTAQRPGDVIRTRNGTTVEVLNTDAEGRLVLADALALAAEAGPDHIVDIATLTGAQMIALGTSVGGAMGDEQLGRRIIDAGRRAGEQFWPMPLPEPLKSNLKSPVADLKNHGERFGSMLFAALFLQSFIPAGQSWAHLDIAGPAWNDGSATPLRPAGGTGFGARTLIQLARDLSST